jgi:hypothetical protein
MKFKKLTETILDKFLESTGFREGSDEEFVEIFKEVYADDDLLNEQILSEQLVVHMTGGKFQTEISNDGKLAIRYLDSKEYVVISAMISTDKKMNRQHVQGIKELKSKLIDAFKAGKSLLTSLNNFSKPFIENILKEMENSGYTVEKQSLGTVTKPDGVWESAVFSFKKI